MIKFVLIYAILLTKLSDHTLCISIGHTLCNSIDERFWFVGLFCLFVHAATRLLQHSTMSEQNLLFCLSKLSYEWCFFMLWLFIHIIFLPIYFTEFAGSGEKSMLKCEQNLYRIDRSLDFCQVIILIQSVCCYTSKLPALRAVTMQCVVQWCDMVSCMYGSTMHMWIKKA